MIIDIKCSFCGEYGLVYEKYLEQYGDFSPGFVRHLHCMGCGVTVQFDAYCYRMVRDKLFPKNVWILEEEK